MGRSCSFWFGQLWGQAQDAQSFCFPHPSAPLSAAMGQTQTLGNMVFQDGPLRWLSGWLLLLFSFSLFEGEWSLIGLAEGETGEARRGVNYARVREKGSKTRLKRRNHRFCWTPPSRFRTFFHTAFGAFGMFDLAHLRSICLAYLLTFYLSGNLDGTYMLW